MSEPVPVRPQRVLIFRPFPLEVGQKITLASGPRAGDWEVIGVSERKVRLRCPVSHKEVEWDHFCYLVEVRENEPWPHLG